MASAKQQINSNETIMNEFNKSYLKDWPKKVDIARLNQCFGSPAWVVSENQLISNVKVLEIFTDETSRIFYPVKTNPSLTVLQILAKLGVGADCASQLEINMALFAGIKIENISYNSPAQDVNICKTLLESGAKVVMDDIDTMLELQKTLKETEFRGKLFLRVNLLEYAGYSQIKDNQELMAHGHKSSKFGIPVEDLENLLKQITIPISGLHVHVGTQMDNMHSFEYAIKELNKLADRLSTLGHNISDINIGGGLGIPFSSNDTFPSLEYWCSYMLQFKNNKYNYSAEPGHALVGNAVSLLTKILSIKKSRGKKWAIVNVGTDQLAKVTLLRWTHRILDESGEELTQGTDAIAGPLCFAGDTLAENVSVSNLKKGSPLLITEAGAYTYSLSNKFNGRLAPKWLLIKANGEQIQTMANESLYDDLQHTKYEWNAIEHEHKPVELDMSEISNLSSLYLKETSREDSFEYKKVCKFSKNEFEFTVFTSSSVSFISMPFAIRIIGDASIIAILHKDAHSQKDFPVWGQKLSIDCFGIVESNKPLEFTITLSESKIIDSKKYYVSRFKSSCGKLVGSLIVTYKN